MRRAVICGHDLVVPDNVADWERVQGDSDFERPRLESILSTLRYGSVVYDVGAEHGWMSAILGKHVGGNNMVLIEPTAEFWPNIKRCWDENDLLTPIACVPCFAGDVNSGPLFARSWPAAAAGDEAPAGPYRNMMIDDVGCLSIDFIARAMNAPPAGVTIDVEGAEHHVLKGMAAVMKRYRPHVWVSIHEDMMEDFGTTPDDVMGLMRNQRYIPHELGVDHERHVYFEPWR